jgi:hypothetical protein
MRIEFALAVFLLNAAIAFSAELREVASFPDKQITGVGVSTKSGRIFVNWSSIHATRKRRQARRGRQSVDRPTKENATANRIRWHRARCEERLPLLPRADRSHALPDQDEFSHR